MFYHVENGVVMGFCKAFAGMHLCNPLWGFSVRYGVLQSVRRAALMALLWRRSRNDNRLAEPIPRRQTPLRGGAEGVAPGQVPSRLGSVGFAFAARHLSGLSCRNRDLEHVPRLSVASRGQPSLLE